MAVPGQDALGPHPLAAPDGRASGSRGRVPRRETANHTERVSRYCALLARLGGLSQRRSELIGAASKMHDIGKLGIPDGILRKPGPLNRSEREHMQRHAEYGRNILAGESDPLLDLAAAIAWTHHERWDGDGYPRHLAGEEIPLEGRIVAIADVFDALTSHRVYRPAMALEHALGMIRAGRETHFDPALLDLFLDALPQMLEIRRCHPDRTLRGDELAVPTQRRPALVY